MGAALLSIGRGVMIDPTMRQAVVSIQVLDAHSRYP